MNYQYLRLSREIKTKPTMIKEFNKYFGFRRYIFNRAKQIHENLLGENYGKRFQDINGNNISFRMIRDCIKRNKINEWESEYSSQIIDTAVEDYFIAYERYMLGISESIPSYKNKLKSTESFRFNMKQWNTEENKRTFSLIDNIYLKLPKITTKIGLIKLKEPLFHNKYEKMYELNGFQMTSITIIKKADRFYAVFAVKFEEGSFYKELPEKCAGLSFGLNELVTLAYKNNKEYSFKIYDSNKIHKKYQLYSKRIKWYRVMLNRKMEGSSSWKKIRTKLQKTYWKILNLTEYNHHVMTKDILNDFMYISVDMFKVMDYIKDSDSSEFKKELYMNNTYRFYLYLTYKYDLYGGVLIEPDDDFDSISICSNCGHIHKKNKKRLYKKKFKCSNCGFKFNNNANAAINLEKYLVKNI